MKMPEEINLVLRPNSLLSPLKEHRSLFFPWLSLSDEGAITAGAWLPKYRVTCLALTDALAVDCYPISKHTLSLFLLTFA